MNTEKITIIGFFIFLFIAIFFCDISGWLNLNLCSEVSHTISYGVDETDNSTDVSEQ